MRCTQFHNLAYSIHGFGVCGCDFIEHFFERLREHLSVIKVYLSDYSCCFFCVHLLVSSILGIFLHLCIFLEGRNFSFGKAVESVYLQEKKPNIGQVFSTKLIKWLFNDYSQNQNWWHCAFVFNNQCFWFSEASANINRWMNWLLCDGFNDQLNFSMNYHPFRVRCENISIKSDCSGIVMVWIKCRWKRLNDRFNNNNSRKELPNLFCD